MKNLRFYLGVFFSGFFVLPYAIPKANRLIRNKKGKYTVDQKYHHAMVICKYMRRHFWTRTYVYGLDNLPKDDGFILYGNHQGKFDALGIFESTFEATGKRMSILWEKKQASRILSRQICGLMDAVPIDLQNPREIVRSMNRVTEIVGEKRNILIFPEGGYTDNHNTLQEFNSGCITPLIKNKATIVPVAIYDSYKSMNGNSLKRVKTQIHYLPSIPYEEYKEMNKKEIVAMIKARIQAKIDEISEEPKEELYQRAELILK